MTNQDQQARMVAALTAPIQDTLRTAATIASRASEHTGGTPAALLFRDAEKAIQDLLQHPALKALASAGLPPSLLG